MNLRLRVAGARHQRRRSPGTARSSSTRSVQTSLASPIDTQTSVWMKSTPATRLGGIVGDRDLRAGARGDARGRSSTTSVGRLQSSSGPARRTSLPMQRTHDQQRAAHVEPAVAHEGVGERVVGLAAGLVHGQEVGEHLGRVPLVGEAVVDGHAGVLGELLDVVLGVAAELDGVVHAPEHPGGVGDRLLVAELRAGRVEVGDVGALVVGGDLEGGPRPGRGLLEDQRDLLARRGAAPRSPRTWRSSAPRRASSRKRSSLGREVDLLEEAAVAEVVTMGVLLAVGGQNAGSRSMRAGHAVGAAAAPAELEALDGDDLDAGLAQRGVGAGVALVGDDDAGLEGDDVVAVVPLLALGLELVAAGRRSPASSPTPSASRHGARPGAVVLLDHQVVRRRRPGGSSRSGRRRRRWGTA